VVIRGLNLMRDPFLFLKFFCGLHLLFVVVSQKKQKESDCGACDVIE
jgi:hypothetical protein